MKRLFLILSFAVSCAAGTQAQFGGSQLPQAPPEPPSRCIDCPSPSIERGSVRSRDETKPEEDRPKPPTKAERKQWEARQKLVEAQKHQIKGELARLSRGFQIKQAQPTIELTPQGHDYFNISDVNEERSFGQIMVASLSGIATPSSRIPLENLRRAAAILETFKPGNIGNMSQEDMSYLASQSALAMEGAPLSVEITESPVGREDDTRRLVQQAQDVENVRADAERATAERLRVEEQLIKVNSELHSGYTEALKAQREILLQTYKAAYKDEANKKATVQDMTGKVTVVWEKGTVRSPK